MIEGRAAQRPNAEPLDPAGWGRISTLFCCGPLRLAGSSGRMAIDLGLDRGTRLSEEVLVMARREGVAAAQQVPALLEMRVDKARHQLVMLFGRVPVGPVVRQFANHAAA